MSEAIETTTTTAPAAAPATDSGVGREPESYSAGPSDVSGALDQISDLRAKFEGGEDIGEEIPEPEIWTAEDAIREAEENTATSQDGDDPATEGEGDQIDPAALQSEVQTLRQMLSKYQEKEMSEEVARRRAGDPSKGIAPDPLAGREPEVAAAWKSGIADKVQEYGQVVQNAAYGTLNRHVAPLDQALAGVAPLVEAFNSNTLTEAQFPAMLQGLIDLQQRVSQAVPGLVKELDGLHAPLQNTMQDWLLQAMDSAHLHTKAFSGYSQECQAAVQTFTSQFDAIEQPLIKAGLSGFTEEEKTEAINDLQARLDRGEDPSQAIAEALKPIQKSVALSQRMAQQRTVTTNNRRAQMGAARPASRSIPKGFNPAEIIANKGESLDSKLKRFAKAGLISA